MTLQSRLSPSFGLWYDFRQRLPFERDYASFYAECLEEIEEGERLGFSGVWLSEYHFVDDGYLPSPLVAITRLTTSGCSWKSALGRGSPDVWHYGEYYEDRLDNSIYKRLIDKAVEASMRVIDTFSEGSKQICE